MEEDYPFPETAHNAAAEFTNIQRAMAEPMFRATFTQFIAIGIQLFIAVFMRSDYDNRRKTEQVIKSLIVVSEIMIFWACAVNAYRGYMLERKYSGTHRPRLTSEHFPIFRDYVVPILAVRLFRLIAGCVCELW